MGRVVANDASAQREVVHRLIGRAQRLSRALLRDSADAMDASQVSLVEILQSARSYRGESSLERWADRIVARTAIRWARKERRARSIDSPRDSEAPPTGEAGAIARQFLAGLPNEQRVAIVLRHVFEYSVEEIADMTDTSPNTVKDRLVRGRETIRSSVRGETQRARRTSGGGRNP